jgi:soluble lytic murein transglycosylase
MNRLARYALGALFTVATFSAIANPLAEQRRQFEAAWQAAKSEPGPRWRLLARGLERYPLYPYLEFAALDRDLRRADAASVRDFIVRHQDTLLGERLRTRWLTLLAERARWTDFRALWREQNDVTLRCHHARARLATAALDGLADSVEALWLSPRSLPAACDDVLAWFAREGHLSPDLIWQRIALAAAARQHGLIAHLAAGLAGSERAEAQRWATTIANPDAGLARVTGWAGTQRDRDLMALATAQLARRDEALAAQRWRALETRFAFTEVQRGRALHAIALYHAADFATDTEAWAARVPAAHVDQGLSEWRVRGALGRSDFRTARAAIAAMPEASRNEARWRYLAARLTELAGDAAVARTAYAELAREANFHGFLAAERVGEPYSICALEPDGDPRLALRVKRNPGLTRAFELLALERRREALAEWNFALPKLDPAARRVAVSLALARGWIDRGPFTLLDPVDQRYYALRFPLGWAETVKTHARRHKLDPALVFGLIRSESAWIIDARSSAGARGLMQVMPANGPRLAKLERLSYRNAADLDRPALNIALGTRYLADAIARADGRIWVAAAAYNAGPSPVSRWLAERPGLPVDLWIETIPYKETREYVARVLAFSVIYDWRLEGRAASLLARLGLAPDPGARRPVVCALPPASEDTAVNAP